MSLTQKLPFSLLQVTIHPECSLILKKNGDRRTRERYYKYCIFSVSYSKNYKVQIALCKYIKKYKVIQFILNNNVYAMFI